ncbi:MAG: TonB-dependent receptor, partial [Halioglobus sp.]|nr:TonB-dependent receptor [Halioglobus sp.]
AYVNVAYEITEDLEVEVGARYTQDDKDFSLEVPTPDSDLGPYFGYGFSTDGFIQAQDSWDDVTGRVLVKWRPTDDGMLFASFTQGFKSGGFGSFSAALADGTPPEFAQTDISTAEGYRPTTFDEETVDSFEIGYKDSLLGGAANYDVTVFYYEYQDLQIVFFDGGASKVENVGEVDAFGIESSVTAALGENFTLYLAASYLDSEANEVQLVCDDPEDENACEGSELFWAPDFTAAAVLDGRFPHGDGAVTTSFEVFWEDERGGGWAGLNETKIDDAAIAALRIGYESGDFWDVELYVENLFDEFKWDGQNNNGAVIPAHFFGPQRGRTIGARINASWD